MTLKERQARRRTRRRPESESIRSLVAPVVRPELRRILPMSFAAIAGGLAEALVLVLIARIALALSGGHDHVNLHVGPIHAIRETVLTLIIAAAVIVLIRVALQVVQNALAARAETSVVNRARQELFTTYLRANWPLQSAEREGRLQELLTTYARSVGYMVFGLTQAVISGLSLMALLAAAFTVNAAASVAAAIAALAIGLMLQPLRKAARRRSARAAQSNAEFATGLTETAAILQAVRIFQVEDSVRERLADLSNNASASAAAHRVRQRRGVGRVPGFCTAAHGCRAGYRRRSGRFWVCLSRGCRPHHAAFVDLRPGRTGGNSEPLPECPVRLGVERGACSLYLECRSRLR